MGSVIGFFKNMVKNTPIAMKTIGGILVLLGGIAVVAISKADNTDLIEGVATLELPEDDADVIDITENVEIEETVTE